MSIRCAHCKKRHETVAAVRDCASVTVSVKKTPVDAPGMYRRGPDVFLVVKSKKSDHFFAKKLVKTMHGDVLHKLHFEYEKGAIFQLSMECRMTIDEVADLGQMTGHCWVCAKQLTVQKSIEAGIGPVCIKKV